MLDDAGKLEEVRHVERKPSLEAMIVARQQKMDTRVEGLKQDDAIEKMDTTVEEVKQEDVIEEVKLEQAQSEKVKPDEPVHIDGAAQEPPSKKRRVTNFDDPDDH
eukprot:2110092-Amphidinium_carterae.1